MPAPKRRRFLNRQRQGRRKAAAKQRTLTPAERMRLSELKRRQYELDDFYMPPGRMKLGERIRANQRGRGGDSRTLKNDANDLHRRRRFRTMRGADGRPIRVNETVRGDLMGDVRRLARQFPGEELRILDDGTGLAEYPWELQSQARREGIRLRVTRTDIDERLPNTEHLSPEELVKRFGRGHFHGAISTFGGTTYSQHQRKAAANLMDVVKPGGWVSVVSEDSGTFTGGRRLTREGIRPLLKNRRNATASEATWKRPGRSGNMITSLFIRKRK